MHRACLIAVVVLLGGCRTGSNYASPVEPRYAGSVAPAAAAKDTLRVVSFNIEYSKETRRAMRFMKSRAELRDADIVLLQEMTAAATKIAADSLGMHYIYYPAIYNRVMRRDIGNAILSRWPIIEDAKLILPSFSRYAKTQRIATAASIRIGSRIVRVYSTHLGTPADLGKTGRATQLKAILDDAARFPVAIIGGDMNSSSIGHMVRDAGYEWPTDTIPKGNLGGRLDHIFVRGLVTLDSAGAGTARLPRTISDHSPIWVRIRAR